MKKLNLFRKFNFEAFEKGKKFVAIGKSAWTDRDNKDNVLGVKYDVVIAVDKTDYGAKDGEVINNLYEKFTVKTTKNIDIPMNSEIKIVGAVASVYGEYSDKLSVVADDIQVVQK